MRTLTISLFCIFLTTFGVSSQTKQQDSLAVLILDRMSDVIGDLESCSFHLSTATDTPDPASGLVKELADFKVYMNGPDKLLVEAHGKRGHRQFMYNGQQLAYYSFDENNYGILSAPGTIIQTIDSIHASYEIEFPAADFFYPAFTDDLIGQTDLIRYLGLIKMDGKEYFHIMASSKDKNFEFWISNDAFYLPAKYAITYKTQKNSPQYQASFSDWKINSKLPASMFDFLPPPGAKQVKIMSKYDQ